MEIGEFVQLVISGGGAAVGSYYFLKWLFERLQVSPVNKRIYAFLLTALFAGAASILWMWLRTAWPVTVQEWVSILFRDMSTAIMVNQIWHAERDLSRTVGGHGATR
ncbi:MAG: hypothetical protein PHU71_06295 [Candidatus Gracilibacteria bacterium]|nr:hypothetical protein [Candidatus Gracilibacteria bacterium]